MALGQKLGNGPQENGLSGKRVLLVGNRSLWIIARINYQVTFVPRLRRKQSAYVRNLTYLK